MAEIIIKSQTVPSTPAATFGSIFENSADKMLYFKNEDGKSINVSGGREVLKTNRTYYVSTTGNDSNDGLSVGTAFLTIQKAVDVSCALDLSIYYIYIVVADGTYTGPTTLKQYIGVGPITILGNATTPTNVIISTTNANCFTGTSCGTWAISGFRVTTTTSGYPFYFNGSCVVTLSNINFGAVGSGYSHIACVNAYISINTNTTINGGANCHYYCSQGGKILDNNNTITSTGIFTISTFAFCELSSVIYAAGSTFTGGTITGTRYIANMCGAIQTGGGGPNYFPGSIAGSTTTGGQYA